MMYNIFVTLNNSPTKLKAFEYLIEADCKEEAIEKVLQNAKSRINKRFSRYKKCTLEVKEEDIY